MAEAAVRRMGAAEFLVWGERQEAKYELVDGVPRAMVGGIRNHDQIIVNLIRLLGNRLRGGPCRPFSSDTAVLIPSGNVRRADVGIDCGRFVGRDRHAAEPLVVIEVLSRTTRAEDAGPKLAEYQQVPSIQVIVHLEPERVLARIWTRMANGQWDSRVVTGRDGRLPLPLGIELPLAEVYEDVEAG